MIRVGGARGRLLRFDIDPSPVSRYVYIWLFMILYQLTADIIMITAVVHNMWIRTTFAPSQAKFR